LKPDKEWSCVHCSHLYDEAVGDPDAGIVPGTPWSDVPEDWVCPDCGASKAGFEMVTW
jgi:rubredoxin